MRIKTGMFRDIHPDDASDLRSALGVQANGPGAQFHPSNGDHHQARAVRGAYGRVPASVLITQAVAGAFTSTATIPTEVEDAMLYLNDDAGAVADVTQVTVNGAPVSITGSLPASCMRDDAALGGPVKGYYLGKVNAGPPLIITGNTKLANAVFSFYLLGKYQGSAGRDIGIAEARGPNPR
jgi:hypothetical protein